MAIKSKNESFNQGGNSSSHKNVEASLPPESGENMYRPYDKSERYYIQMNEEDQTAHVLVRSSNAYEGDNFVYMFDPFTDAIKYGFHDEVIEVDIQIFQKAFSLASAGKGKELYDLGLDARNWDQPK